MAERTLLTRADAAARPSRSYAFQLLAVGTSYYVAAELGLRLALVGQSVTPFWPPTGLALVAVLMFGRRVAPAIAVAAFAVNAPISPSLLSAAGIAIGNTLAPVVAAALLDRVGFQTRMERVKDAVALVFVAALCSMALSATLGTALLVLDGNLTAHDFTRTWLVWWTGDAMGVLVVAPFLWSLRSVRRGVLDRRFALEATVTGLVLAATCVLAFTRREHLMFLVVPVLGWIAWRLGKLGAATAALAVSTSATWAAVHEVGPFAHTSLADRMITLQSFNATVAFTTILLASAVSQRQRLAQRDHRMVETFQRSLLPEHMPDAAGIATAARYIAASADVEVGGDWYDIIPLADGRFGFAVGDVAGHGVPAAATMGQLRTALRAYALEGLAPSAVLGRMNRLLPGLEPTAMATAWYGTFDPATRCLVFSSAGHLPPLLLGNDDARYVDELHGPPLGAVTVVEYAERMCTLRSDQTIVLYTDGLIERRGQSIDDGLDALRTCAQESPRALEDMCDHLVAALLGAAPSDDAALLTIRPLVGARPELQFQRAASPDAVPEARRVLHTWLCDNAVSGDDRFDVLVATTEAYANAVQHAYGITVGTVEIDACISDREVNIAVKDHGSWRATGASRNGGGRGLAMMRALMDSVEVESNSHGTEIRMRRELTQANER